MVSSVGLFWWRVVELLWKFQRSIIGFCFVKHVFGLDWFLFLVSLLIKSVIIISPFENHVIISLQMKAISDIMTNVFSRNFKSVDTLHPTSVTCTHLGLVFDTGFIYTSLVGKGKERKQERPNKCIHNFRFEPKNIYIYIIIQYIFIFILFI